MLAGKRRERERESERARERERERESERDRERERERERDREREKERAGEGEGESERGFSTIPVRKPIRTDAGLDVVSTLIWQYASECLATLLNTKRTQCHCAQHSRKLAHGSVSEMVFRKNGFLLCWLRAVRPGGLGIGVLGLSFCISKKLWVVLFRVVVACQGTSMNTGLL